MDNSERPNSSQYQPGPNSGLSNPSAALYHCVSNNALTAAPPANELAEEYPLEGVTAAELDKYRSLFDKYAGGDQFITFGQLERMLPRVGIFLSCEERRVLHETVDQDGSGDVSFDEFVELVSDHRKLTQLNLAKENRDSFCTVKQNIVVPWWALWPDGPLRVLLDVIALCSICVFAIIAPLDTVSKMDGCGVGYGCPTAVGCLEAGDGGCASLRNMRYPASAVLLTDVAVRLLSIRPPSYWEPATMWTPQFRDVLMQYVKSRECLIDALAGAPFDLICSAAGAHGGRVFFQWLRLLKVLRVPGWRMNGDSGFFPISGRTLVTPAWVHMHYTIVPLLRIAFWSVFILIMCTFAVLLAHKEPRLAYIVAMSHCVQLLTGVGYTAVSLDDYMQYVISIFFVVIHCIVVAALVGHVSLVMQRADIRSDTEKKMLETVNVLGHLKIPPNFTEEILAYQHFVLQTSHQVFTDTLKYLPDNIQERMELYARMNVVQSTHAFSHAPPVCVARLAQSLERITVAPDEHIVIAGEDARDIFFLIHGMCHVLRRDGCCLAIVKRGGVFGAARGLSERTAALGWRRTCGVQSLTYCSLFRLDSRDVADAVSGLPDEQEREGIYAELTRQLRVTAPDGQRLSVSDAELESEWARRSTRHDPPPGAALGYAPDEAAEEEPPPTSPADGNLPGTGPATCESDNGGWPVPLDADERPPPPLPPPAGGDGAAPPSPGLLAGSLNASMSPDAVFGATQLQTRPRRQSLKSPRRVSMAGMPETSQSGHAASPHGRMESAGRRGSVGSRSQAGSAASKAGSSPNARRGSGAGRRGSIGRRASLSIKTVGLLDVAASDASPARMVNARHAPPEQNGAGKGAGTGGVWREKSSPTGAPLVGHRVVSAVGTAVGRETSSPDQLAFSVQASAPFLKLMGRREEIRPPKPAVGWFGSDKALKGGATDAKVTSPPEEGALHPAGTTPEDAALHARQQHSGGRKPRTATWAVGHRKGHAVVIHPVNSNLGSDERPASHGDTDAILAAIKALRDVVEQQSAEQRAWRGSVDDQLRALAARDDTPRSPRRPTKQNSLYAGGMNRRVSAVSGASALSGVDRGPGVSPPSSPLRGADPPPPGRTPRRGGSVAAGRNAADLSPRHSMASMSSPQAHGGYGARRVSSLHQRLPAPQPDLLSRKSSELEDAEGPPPAALGESTGQQGIERDWSAAMSHSGTSHNAPPSGLSGGEGSSRDASPGRDGEKQKRRGLGAALYKVQATSQLQQKQQEGGRKPPRRQASQGPARGDSANIGLGAGASTGANIGLGAEGAFPPSSSGTSLLSGGGKPSRETTVVMERVS